MPTINPDIIAKFQPCPFCQNPLNIEVFKEPDDDDCIEVYLSCKICGIEFSPADENGPDIGDPDALLKWWNGLCEMAKINMLLLVYDKISSSLGDLEQAVAQLSKRI